MNDPTDIRSMYRLHLESMMLFGTNASYIEALYEDYLADPGAVPDRWREYFATLPATNSKGLSHATVRKYFTGYTAVHRPDSFSVDAEKQAAVLRYINAYRVRGHQHAQVDPLAFRHHQPVNDLSASFHGLVDSDFEKSFNTGSLVAPKELKLSEIDHLIRRVYTGTIGSEYMHITSTKQKRWIQERLEGSMATLDTTVDEQRWILRMLTGAEGIERYLHRKYVGQKRFSLEGGEGLIPLLDDLIQRSGEQGVKEVIIGMAHRGRLNVLVNILGKTPSQLFAEFEGRAIDQITGAGDVKYHQGFSSDVESPGGIVHLTLGFNPSHLEIVNPVIEGSVRARQVRRKDNQFNQVMPVLIHGDSSFSGQGVVMETLNMSQIRGYRTGGTVHIVVNNQIGFTTSNPLDTRSTHYCTDVAKMIQAPIVHVNGDDPEAILFVTRMALDYRMTFNRDFVIDLVCYRRHGHNEADEPAVTQPSMYKKIRRKKTTLQLYRDRLIDLKIIEADEAKEMEQHYRQQLDQGHVVSRPVVEGLTNHHAAHWECFRNQRWDNEYEGAVSIERLQTLHSWMWPPKGFALHPRVDRVLSERDKMLAGEIPIDWGCAENLAYASLLVDDIAVRLSGQDCGRGTFAHRHAVLHDQETGDSWVPLQHLHEQSGQGQGKFTVIDSFLSEEAVLGFEYGYATAEPKGLTIWEAQFGDFANGAQVLIDQFISAAETKWGLFCGLVIYLPHGYEGQGPEHSSARLERYLHLCADHNMQVCMPTTPAQIFNLLRRQALRQYRKPLVVMTPKSLLRHKTAVSSLSELASGQFFPVIDDDQVPDGKKITRLILCSGKVYYDLLEAKQVERCEHIAIVRIEQLYPFPHEAFSYVVSHYPHIQQIIWCQEEPQNQGAWYQVQHRFHKYLDDHQVLHYVGRPASASPAVGYYRVHVEQQNRLVQQALYGE